jgi:hypothetical protein
MARIFVTSYATSNFASVRQDLNESAEHFGISNILSYAESDLLSSDYYAQNRSILDEICGAGYWAWKPYFILKACEALEERDILFYCDAGSMFVSPPEPLVELATKQPQGLVLFDARPLINRQFTKRDCFVRMDCDSDLFWNANKVIATILVIRKCDFAVKFLNEWLYYCKDRAAITDDPNVSGLDDLPGYLQHRWDQAILSVLTAKHSLETFRNPTLWGNFLKLPRYRISGEPVVSPYGLVPDIRTYASIPQKNSPYGTIFVINRQPNYVGKKPLPAPAISTQPSFVRKLLSWTRRRLTIVGSQST